MNRVFPVDGSTTQIFFGEAHVAGRSGRSMWTRFRPLLRLIASSRTYTIRDAPINQDISETVTDDVHRYRESIAGRPYLIEVKAVTADRWRAYIVRIPGVPTALMPFYGKTPDEAARSLCDWLTRAHQLAAKPTGTV
jgi:hypothetical protein